MRSLKSNLLAVHGFRPAPIFVRRRCKYTHLSSNNNQNNEKSYHFLQKLALQCQKEECHQAGSAARQRAAQEVSGPQFQRQAHCHLHAGHSQVIRTKQIKRRYDADYFREMALFTAMPK